MSAQQQIAQLPAVIGKYTLVSELGRGGMGTVYKATTPDGQTLAVKVLASHLNNNDVQLKRFYQEAQIAMRLDHPNIVRAVEVGESEGQHYFAMEFIDGESLGGRLKRDGKMPEKECIRVIVAVAQALHKAHKDGLIHRDIKPDNIMLTKDGGVKLADMGLAKAREADLNLTKTGRGLGTPHFMAPEQFRNAKNADVRCDVYSLGATLYMMVSGELPFKGASALDAFFKKTKNEYPPPEQYTPELSKRTSRTIRLAMDADPEKRPPTAKRFVEMLLGKSLTSSKSASLTEIRAGDVSAAPEGEGEGDAELPPVPASPTSAETLDQIVWYVIFTDPQGQQQRVKGTLAALIPQIQKGRIGADAQGCRNKDGPFIPLSRIGAFQDLLNIPEIMAESDDEEMITPSRTGRANNPANRPPTNPEPFPYLPLAFILVGVLIAVCAIIWLLSH